ncbi:MAG: hypothetical protein KF897_00385 [Opitutaceae bacterium]|nr:hypothetical protein [Opitutaceae bacterium]
MQSTAQEVLADLKAKRELTGPALHFRDYWRTYGLLVLYGAAVPFLAVNLKSHIAWIFGYAATTAIIATAVNDSRRAINRRFEVLVELLQKKGVL